MPTFWEQLRIGRWLRTKINRPDVDEHNQSCAKFDECGKLWIAWRVPVKPTLEDPRWRYLINEEGAYTVDDENVKFRYRQTYKNTELEVPYIEASITEKRGEKVVLRILPYEAEEEMAVRTFYDSYRLWYTMCE